MSNGFEDLGIPASEFTEQAIAERQARKKESEEQDARDDNEDRLAHDDLLRCQIYAYAFEGIARWNLWVSCGLVSNWESFKYFRSNVFKNGPLWMPVNFIHDRSPRSNQPTLSIASKSIIFSDYYRPEHANEVFELALKAIDAGTLPAKEYGHDDYRVSEIDFIPWAIKNELHVPSALREKYPVVESTKVGSPESGNASIVTKVSPKRRGRPTNPESQRLGRRIYKAKKSGTSWEEIVSEYAEGLTESLRVKNKAGRVREYDNAALTIEAKRLNKNARTAETRPRK